jgi:hypothetical protein
VQPISCSTRNTPSIYFSYFVHKSVHARQLQCRTLWIISNHCEPWPKAKTTVLSPEQRESHKRTKLRLNLRRRPPLRSSWHRRRVKFALPPPNSSPLASSLLEDGSQVLPRDHMFLLSVQPGASPGAVTSTKFLNPPKKAPRSKDDIFSTIARLHPRYNIFAYRCSGTIFKGNSS